MNAVKAGEREGKKKLLFFLLGQLKLKTRWLCSGLLSWCGNGKVGSLEKETMTRTRRDRVS